MELYLFFASWMKTFEVKPGMDDTQLDLEGVHVAIFQPKLFEVRMIARDYDSIM